MASEMTPRNAAVALMAALCFATAEDASDATISTCFDIAERFVAEAEKRYGSIPDPED